MSKSIAGGKYRLEKVLAAGSFGKVFEDPPFAIKEIKVPSRLAHSRTVANIIANEINILTHFNHDNIVKLFQIVEEKGFIYIVMELCDGDLRRFTECGPVGENLACHYLRQILNGYHELVKQGIVHRDLKPANILTKNHVLKIADFGMSKLQEGSELFRSHVGTPYYMAPQVLQRIDYTRKCDIWSIGVIFYELLFGQLPWTGRNEEGLLTSIMTQPLKVPSALTDTLKVLLEGMLAISEARRLTFAEAEKLLTLHEETEYHFEEKSVHWSLVRELLVREAEQASRTRYRVGFEELKTEQKKEVRAELVCLFREEEVYLLDYLPV